MPKTRVSLEITIFAILTSVLMVPTVLSPATSNASISTSGTIASMSALHVEGKDIKDSYGKALYLRGANKVEFADDPDGIWMGNTIWNEANVIAELDAMKSWGLNVIRCHQAIEHWKYDMNQPYAGISHKAAIKRLLTLAADRGIYVIYDGFSVTNYWHGGGQDPLPYPPYQTSQGASSVVANEQQFIDLWASIATELKDYANVIFEPWNEPHGDDRAKQSWFNVLQRCIDAIRATGAKQLIVCQWDYACWVDLDYPPPNNPASTMDWIWQVNLTDPAGNLVYSTHMYRSYGHFHHSVPSYWNAWNYSDIQLAFQYFKFPEVTAKYPFFLGEIGADTTYTGTELQRELRAFGNCLKMLDEMKMNYAAFWWRDIGAFALHNGEPNFTPNKAGQILKTHLLISQYVLASRDHTY